MTRTTEMRIAIVLTGIGLPYVARIPGIFWRGPDWIAGYLGSTPSEALIMFVLIGAFNAINWGAILVGSFSLRTVPGIIVAAAVGFALPLLGHATLNLSADALAGVALIFIPIYSLPIVIIGWFLGHAIDRFSNR